MLQLNIILITEFCCPLKYCLTPGLALLQEVLSEPTVTSPFFPPPLQGSLRVQCSDPGYFPAPLPSVAGGASSCPVRCPGKRGRHGRRPLARPHSSSLPAHRAIQRLWRPVRGARRRPDPAPNAGNPGSASPYINRPFASLRPRVPESKPVPSAVSHSPGSSSLPT